MVLSVDNTLRKEELLKRLETIKRRIGNTPVIPLEGEKVNLFAKVEYANFMGSIKDRTAYQVVRGGIRRGAISEDTVIIEASSGNFALSTAALCHFLGLQFVAVIDPNVNRVYAKLISYFASDTLIAEELDENDGYLGTKLQMVEDFCRRNPNSFWTNQYDNPDNFIAHYEGTGQEICDQFDRLDYAFVSVATGGTIAGVSRRLKKTFPHIKIIAVDTEGSVIFKPEPKRRLIPGMGSGIQPPLVARAQIDEVVHVPEPKTIAACRRLLMKHGLFVGGSSGTAYEAVRQYFADKHFSEDEKPNALFICADRGLAYADNLYDHDWLRDFERFQGPIPELD